MARKIVWSDPAIDDLEAAIEFIAKDSQAYAANLAQLTVHAAESLLSSPIEVIRSLILSSLDSGSSSSAHTVSSTSSRRSV